MENEVCLIVTVALLAAAAGIERIAGRLSARKCRRPKPEPLQEAAEFFDVFMLPKGRERYILLVSPSQAAEAIATVYRWAADPELSFTPEDAATFRARIQSSLGCIRPTAISR